MLYSIACYIAYVACLAMLYSIYSMLYSYSFSPFYIACYIAHFQKLIEVGSRCDIGVVLYSIIYTMLYSTCYIPCYITC